MENKILGFDSQGNVTNYSDSKFYPWDQIIDMSTKILTFIDGEGRQHYTSKLVTSLCSMYPDYTLVVIAATQGITKRAEEHFKLAALFQVPIAIVITHIDQVDEDDLESLIIHVNIKD
mgnify:CR=1 FL=1